MPNTRRSDPSAAGVFERLRQPSPRTRLLTFVAITLLSSVYLTASTVINERDLRPKSHDEQSYAIQTQMLARGRLWMPPHELADFFESFQMLARPVYASIYFPGSALMYVPGVWLSLPSWVFPVMVSGLALGLAYLLVTRLVDGIAGLLVVLLVLAGQWFRLNATLVMSQSPMMLLGLGMLLAWLKWRETKRWSWAACIGACAGWAAIVRPVDALAFAIPVGIAMLLDFRSLPMRRIGLACTAVVIAALPFLSLQLVANKGTTGHWLRAPHTLYLETDQPQTTYGFHKYDPQARPRSTLAQKEVYYQGFMHPDVLTHQPDRIARIAWDRLKLTADVALPTKLLLILVIAGLWRVNSLPRAVVISVAPIFFLLYLPYTFYMEHYVIPIIVPLLLLVVLGVEQLVAFSRSIATRRKLTITLAALLIVVALTSLPELNPRVRDNRAFAYTVTLVRNAIRERVRAAAIVLVRYDPTDLDQNPHEEPVYNWDTAWPDDAPVIVAHDLGARNMELIRYYERTQPNRQYWLFDRKGLKLQGPGTAADLVRAIAAAEKIRVTSQPAAQ